MNSASTHKNPDFWIFGLFFFLYFFHHGNLFSVFACMAVRCGRTE